jgi:hypothetical protein
MLAVLIDAIRTVGRPTAARSHAYRAWLSDREWLLADDYSEPFSFVNICGALGFNAEYVRRSVLHPPPTDHPARLLRYAAKVEESWLRLRRQSAKGPGSAHRAQAPASGPQPAPPSSDALCGSAHRA